MRRQPASRDMPGRLTRQRNHLMSRSTERTLALGFGIALAVLTVNAVLTFRNIGQVVHNGEWVRHSHEVLAALESAVAALHEIESGQRDYLLTGDEAPRERHLAGVTD